MSRIILGTFLRRNVGAKYFSTSIATPTVNPPRLFDYKTIVSNLKPSISSITAIESAFGMLAKGQVGPHFNIFRIILFLVILFTINFIDVPIPMHIGIHESEVC